jgi:hypothetical protein
MVKICHCGKLHAPTNAGGPDPINNKGNLVKWLFSLFSSLHFLIFEILIDIYFKTDEVINKGKK